MEDMGEAVRIGAKVGLGVGLCVGTLDESSTGSFRVS